MSSDPVEAAREVLAAAWPFPAVTAEGDPLAGLLYERWFHGATGQVRRYPNAAAYRAMALAARPFEPGWTFAGPAPGAPGTVRLSRGETVRDAPPLCWAPADGRRLTAAEGEAALVAPLRDGPQGGFWHLWSPVWPAREPRYLSRWYLQLAEGAELAAAAALAAAAPPERAWAAKILAGDHPSGRRDRALLYAPVAEAPWIAAILDAVGPLLDDAPGPPFTQAVARGVARADDPGEGQSFGQHRAALLASAARLRPEAVADATAWHATVAERFAMEGLSLDEPWRGRRRDGR